MTAIGMGAVQSADDSGILSATTKLVAVGDSIQTAIDDVGAGGCVLLAPGTHTISTGLTISNDGVRLLALGRAIVQRTASVTSLSITGDFVLVEGIEWTEDADYGATFIDYTVASANTGDIIGNHIEGFDTTPASGKVGIFVNDATSLNIDNNKIINCEYGIRLLRDAAAEKLYRIKIRGNYIVTFTTASATYGIHINNAYAGAYTAFIQVLGNYVETGNFGGGIGIYIGSTSTNLQGFLVSGNMCYGRGTSSSAGIKLVGSATGNIQSARISGNFIWVYDVSIDIDYAVAVNCSDNNMNSPGTNSIAAGSGATNCVAYANSANGATYTFVAGWTQSGNV